MQYHLHLIYISLSLLLISLLLILTPPALAQEPDYDRVNEIAKDLNCPTCTGINLADCRTQTCEQWRGQIADLVQEGYNDEEVLDYFVTRYGDQVLQEPPKHGSTLVLWLLPIIVILAAGAWLVYTMRGWINREPAPVAVTAAPASPTQSSSDIPDLTGDYLKQVDKDLGLD